MFLHQNVTLEVVEQEIKAVLDFLDRIRFLLPNILQVGPEIKLQAVILASIQRKFSQYNKILSDERCASSENLGNYC